MNTLEQSFSVEIVYKCSLLFSLLLFRRGISLWNEESTQAILEEVCVVADSVVETFTVKTEQPKTRQQMEQDVSVVLGLQILQTSKI